VLVPVSQRELTIRCGPFGADEELEAVSGYVRNSTALETTGDSFKPVVADEVELR